MRKTLFTLVALLTAMVGFAQENLALNKTAIATSGEAAQAVDGNEGTRWESASTNEEVWQVDLGSAQEFNTIQILWEGAYTKTFTIEAGDEVGTDGYLTNGAVIVNVQNETPELKPNVQNYKLAAPVTARYIKFNVIERGTVWGNSFWEFRVFNAPDPVLTSITLSAAAAYAKVGTGVALTAQGKDQLGGDFATGTLQYTVNPTDAGTISGNTYTPAKAGAATITAAQGDIVSNAVTVTAYAGEKIDLFTNWNDRIEAIGQATEGSKVGAFDDNLGSNWDLLGATTANDEASRTYDVGFIADLGAQYDITAISIMFEGACSQEYAISFAGSNKQFGAPAFSYVGAAGINAHTDFLVDSEAENSTKGVRYVKFLSTKAATEWSVKIFDFSVYGTASTLDATVPTLDEVSAEATGDNSIKVTAKGSDTAAGDLTYTITLNDEAKTVKGAAGAAVEAEFNGLKPGKEYTATVVVENEAGVKGEAKTATATTTGTADPNLWIGASKNVTVWIGDEGWAPQPVPEDYILTDNSLEITNPEATFNGEWHYQVKIFTDITTEANKDVFYDFKCKIDANNDTPYSLKLTDKNDNGNDYIFLSRKDITAGETLEIKHVKMKSLNAENLILILDFGGAPANTTIKISDILFKVNDGEEPDPVLPFTYDDTNNLWKKFVDDAEVQNIGSYYAHTNDWVQYDPIEYNKEGSEYTVNLPNESDLQWQAQFNFNSTGISTTQGTKYDFSVIINPNTDLTGVTIKLTDPTDENNVWFFADRYDLVANTDNVIRYEAVASPATIADLKLVYDFGGNPANTVVKIKDTVFKETSPKGDDPNPPSAINAVSNAAQNANAPMYNLAGQRVGSNYRGIVIQNGQKRVIK